jgi:thiamine-phosphate pyrophosphorylase
MTAGGSEAHQVMVGLYPVLDSQLLPVSDFAAAARVAVDGGCRQVQLRMKSMSDRDRLEAQRSVMAALAGRGALLVINDRADLARVLMIEAPEGVAMGLHLGQDDLPPGQARELLGPSVHIALSTHSLAQVEASEREPVDAIAYGPVFSTASKKTLEAEVGLDGLARAVAASSRPVIAIGGLDPSRARACLQCGASAAAVISDLFRPGSTAALPGRIAAYGLARP